MLNINLNNNRYKSIEKHKQTLSKVIAKINNLIVKERILIANIIKCFINCYYVLLSLHRNFILKN